jgi:4-diphosphocytidyl-2-C-methyl-D-erythritol kinase
MLVFPKAKINLGLNITGRRDDGYHDIETIFYPVGLCDALEAVAGEGGSETDILNVTGYGLKVAPEDNIALKAIKILRQHRPFPMLRINLHKVIPAGAGLGGGSSDAACMLRIIDRMFSLNIPDETLKEIALQLGSDCPFFIDSRPSFAKGRGEILEPVAPVLKGFHIVLLNPGIQVSTREAYESCEPSVPDNSLKDLVNRPVGEWKNLIGNDFEKTVFRKYPLIGDLKAALYSSGSLYSSMSGSGSTVYGIFAGKPSIPDRLRDYVIFSGTL